MKTFFELAALIVVSAAMPFAASAQTSKKPINPAIVDRYIQSTFGKAPKDWQDRIVPDDTLKACNAAHNEVSGAEADKITAREIARVVYPADGKLLGDWKEGAKIANNGRGGQFSDPPDTVAGGNCYACHQMEQKEVSYGTLGPSLTNYGKDRKYDPSAIKDAYTKVYDSQAVLACSNMPRFGVNKVLNEQQIKDIVAFLFDPASPINK